MFEGFQPLALLAQPEEKKDRRCYGRRATSGVDVVQEDLTGLVGVAAAGFRIGWPPEHGFFHLQRWTSGDIDVLEHPKCLDGPLVLGPGFFVLTERGIHGSLDGDGIAIGIDPSLLQNFHRL